MTALVRANHRYLILFANPAEARGTGGLWGLYTFVSFDRGRIQASPRSGRLPEDFPEPGKAHLSTPLWLRRSWGGLGVTRIWQNLNLSPDFPTAARSALDALSGQHADGVIQIDPVGLSAFLRATGPVSIPSWPDLVTADNVEAIATREVYARFRSSSSADEARRERVGAETISAVFHRLLDSPLLSMRGGVLSAVTEAAAHGHLEAYSNDLALESSFKELGIAGDLDRASSADDVVGVFTNNAAGNKLDVYVTRTVTDDVRLDPRSGIARAHITVTLENRAPAELPAYVVGSTAVPGHARSIVEVLRPAGDILTDARLNGGPAFPTTEDEARLHGYRLMIDLPAGKTARIDLTTSTTVRPGRYRLVVLPQPASPSDRYKIDVHLPLGWAASDRRHIDETASTTTSIDARIHETILGRLLHL
jgi:hypothetical protein